MKVYALLSWYEESPAWLSALTAGLAGIADHLVALDGPFALFEGSRTRPRSASAQAEALLATAAGAGLGLTLGQSSEAWAGEVEKRTALFALARGAGATPEDWLLVVDGDEQVQATASFRPRLAEVQEDVAEVRLWSRWVDAPLPGERGARIPYEEIHAGASPLRALFRALPDLRVEGAHYVYVAGPPGAPRYLWGHPGQHDLVPAADLRDYIGFEHLTEWRALGRDNARREYYRLRDEVGAERLLAP